MIENIAAYMKRHQMAQQGEHISAALSGGADSVCLFLALEKLRHAMGFSLSAIHIEHGIRGEQSREDMQFVQQLAQAYDIPLTCKAYPVKEIAKEQGLSLEEAGRKVRYTAFEEERQRLAEKLNLRPGTVKTAVAHHGDDNAETMLFHLCRGSGIEGMAGIHPVRGQIIRPLLCTTRCEIERFLQDRQQPYRIDESNADVNYSRNRIRHRMIPELMRINQAGTAHMSRLSEDVQEICAYLQQETDKILEEYLQETNGQQGKIYVFRTEGLLPYPPFLQKRILLELAARTGGSKKDLSREHAEALFDLAGGRTGRKLSLPYGVLAENSYGTLIFSQYSSEMSGVSAVRIPIREERQIPVPGGCVRIRIFGIPKKDVKIPKNLYTKWFDCDKIKNRLYLRTREPGDYFTLDLMGHKQKLKDYWINEKVPKSERSRILLLADGSHILWAVGYRISEYYKVSGHTKRVMEVQFMEDE